MPEMDGFERHLSNALIAYAHEMPSRVDSAAVARRVAGERNRGPWLPAMPRLAWILIVAVLLALAAGLVMVGSGLIERPHLLPATNHGITFVAPNGWGNSQAVAGFEGDVWVLEQSGLARLDPTDGTVRTWGAGDDLAFMASGIAPARGGGVWLLSSQKVRRFDGERLSEPLRIPPEAKTVAWVAESPDGSLWAATDGGLYRWSAGSWSPVPDLPEGAAAAPLALDSRGNAWAVYPGPAFRVARYDGTAWTTFTSDSTGAPLSDVTSLVADETGGVWAGTKQGLAHFDGSAWTTFGVDQLGVNNTWSPAVDQAGNVWAVTSRVFGSVHVARFRDGAWTRWGPEAGLPGPDTTGFSNGAIAVVPSGPFVSVPSAIYRLVGDRWEQAWRDPAGDSTFGRALVPGAGVEAWGLSNTGSDGSLPRIWHHTSSGVSLEPLPAGVSWVNQIAVGPDAIAWLATDGGVAVRNDGRWTVVDPRPMVGMTIAPDGTTWAMGSDSSLHVIRHGVAGWMTSDVPGSASTDGTIWAARGPGPNLAVDGAGHVWANGGWAGYSHAPGLRRFDGRQWQSVLPAGTTSDSVFGSVSAAPDGSVWVTIDGTAFVNGCCNPADPATQVARFNGTDWTVYSTADGLPADTSNRSLVVTRDGVVWLSTTAGIYRFDGRAWHLDLAIGDYYFWGIAAAPDGAIWTTGTDGPILRIADPR